MTTERQLIALQVAMLLTLGLIAALTVDVRRLQRATAPRLVTALPNSGDAETAPGGADISYSQLITTPAHEKAPPDESAGLPFVLTDRAD